jgi:hypothetical protein
MSGRQKAGAVTDAIARFYGREKLPFVRRLASAGRNAAAWSISFS